MHLCTCQVDVQGSTAHNKDNAQAWTQLAAKLSRDLVVHHGVDAGPCELLLHLRPCEGLVRTVEGAIEKRFSKSETSLPVQVRLLHGLVGLIFPADFSLCSHMWSAPCVWGMAFVANRNACLCTHAANECAWEWHSCSKSLIFCFVKPSSHCHPACSHPLLFTEDTDSQLVREEDST